MSTRDNFVIYRDVPVLVNVKDYHVRKMGGRLRYAFNVSYGEIPVAVFNDATKKFEPVVNPRGYAYGARKRQMYRINRKGRASAKDE